MDVAGYDTIVLNTGSGKLSGTGMIVFTNRTICVLNAKTDQIRLLKITTDNIEFSAGRKSDGRFADILEQPDLPDLSHLERGSGLKPEMDSVAMSDEEVTQNFKKMKDQITRTQNILSLIRSEELSDAQIKAFTDASDPEIEEKLFREEFSRGVEKARKAAAAWTEENGAIRHLRFEKTFITDQAIADIAPRIFEIMEESELFELEMSREEFAYFAAGFNARLTAPAPSP